MGRHEHLDSRESCGGRCAWIPGNRVAVDAPAPAMSAAPSTMSGTHFTSLPPPPKLSTLSTPSPNVSAYTAPSYESFAPRSTEQRHRLSRLASLTSAPPATPHDPTRSLASVMCPPSSLPSLPSPSSIDPAISSTWQHTLTTTQQLTQLLQHTHTLQLALHASRTMANEVSTRHSDLLRQSGELSANAERLQHEESVLTRRATEMGRPLQQYDAVDTIGGSVGVWFQEGGMVRGRPKIHVDESFVKMLEDIDHAMEYFGENGGVAKYGRGSPSNWRRFPLDPNASGSVEYYRRACAVQDVALEMLRESVVDRITQTTAQICEALHLPKVPISAEKLEASLVYTRFHGISKRSHSFIGMVRKRLEVLGRRSVAASPYEDWLTVCKNTYCGARETLVTGSVRHHMDTLKEKHGLVGMTRLASMFLIRLCTVETALYLDFFGETNSDRKDGVVVSEEKRNHSSAASRQVLTEDSTYRDAEFQSMLGVLCSALHRTIRRGLVSILDLDILCQIVNVLREERTAANSSPTTLAASRAISGVIQDAQERLIYCANSTMHKEVVKFKPTAADLNYPGKLLGDNPHDTNNAETADSKDAPLSSVNDAVAAQLKVYESWFPPMRSVLRVLSKIFRVVEPRIFEDIALQAVQACTKSLKDGSIHIRNKSGQVHADLFLVKHLLILREQLSPFDIQLRSVERQLDFSEAGKAVSRFLANRNRRLFSMSTENALITLLREGVSVQEASVDSKRDLEDCLRSACNDFIEHTSTTFSGPISDLVDQCKNAVGSNEGSSEALINASFMNGVIVKEVFSKTLSPLDAELENVSKQMKLYLESTATQSILLKPVVRKITRTLEESKRFISDIPDGENGWDAETRSEVINMCERLEAKVRESTSKPDGMNVTK